MRNYRQYTELGTYDFHVENVSPVLNGQIVVVKYYFERTNY